MRREFHVRFCEGAGVRFPRATRLRPYFEHEHRTPMILCGLDQDRQASLRVKVRDTER
jgi:hypothetical protein